MAIWLTNLPVSKHSQDFVFYKKYSESEYPKFDNYDAIDVDKVTDIPDDYYGLIGAPITFLDEYNPSQFELVGLAKKPLGDHLRIRVYPRQIQHKVGSEETSMVTKLNDGPALIVDKPPEKGIYYTIGETIYIQKFARILIRRKR